MKKLFLILFLFCAANVSAQYDWFVPLFWKLSGTNLVPNNPAWKVPYANLAITKSDIGLGNVTNNAQVKKAASSTNGVIPKWNGTAGDEIIDGYTVGTAANNLVQLDASAKLPAVDGSQLTGLVSGPEIIRRVKTADEAIVSSTTYQDDDHLTCTVIANRKYILQMRLIIITSSAVLFQAQFVLPSGATAINEVQYLNTTIDTFYGIIWTTDGTLISGYPNEGGLVNKSYVNVYSTITIGATGGTFKLQWAQGTSSADPAKVLAGSSLILMEN